MTSHIVHEVLINPDMLVLGYKLTWHQDDESIPDDANLEAMLLTAAESLVSSDKNWLLGEKQLFLEVTPSLLSADSLKLFPPEKIVLSMDASYLQDANALDTLIKFRKQGFGILIGNVNPAALVDDELMSHVTHLEIDCSHHNPRAATQVYETSKLFPQIRILGKNINTWDEYSVSRPYGLHASAGNFYLEFNPLNEKKRLNPTQSIILQGLDLLNKNADVGLIENELKRDPAITYKLLRYINTAGFSARSDISSLRQAVTYLGYSMLNKWLCVTLAVSSTVPNASVLFEAAMIRGSFVELLGRKRMAKNETDQLFITGIFSLLDRLLGMPMEELLVEIRLSEAIQGALLTRSGVFGRYLSLAEACEHKHGSASSIADSLRINADTVNAAHLRAMIWAQQIQR